MNILKRILLFVVCVAGIVLIADIAGGIVVGILAMYKLRAAGIPGDTHAIGREAGILFFSAYGGLIVRCAIVISSAIAFRRTRALIIFVCLAALYFFTGGFHWKVDPQNLVSSVIATTEKQRAVQLYPELGVPDSALNREFLRRYQRYQSDNKHYFDDPGWPARLAKESTDALSGPSNR